MRLSSDANEVLGIIGDGLFHGIVFPQRLFDPLAQRII